MIKLRILAAVTFVTLSATSAFAAEKACCAMGGAKQVANDTSAKCVSFANLKISAEQKTKLETWQADCMKAGCTQESHAKFLKRAKSVLSADQYVALKKECGPGAGKKA